MVATNEFLTWAIGAGNNCMSGSDYAVNPAQAVGVTVGLADPSLYNKAQRQSAFVTHCLAQFIAANQSLDVLDDGSVANFLSRWQNALGGYLSSNLGNFIRVKAATLTNFYVDGTNGTDAPGNGLASGTSAWRTLQYALDFLQAFYDFSASDAVVNVVGAVLPAVLFGPLVGQRGRRGLQIAASGATTIAAVNASGLVLADGAQAYATGNITITATGTSSNTINGVVVAQGEGIFIAGGGSVFELGTGLTIGACADSQLLAVGGVITTQSNIALAISGGGKSMIGAGIGGKVALGGAPTITLSGTPAYSVATALCATESLVDVGGVVFSGGATGTRYSVSDTSIIKTNGGGANFIPGNAAGTAQNTFNYL